MLLIEDVEIDGITGRCVLIDGGIIREVGSQEQMAAHLVAKGSTRRIDGNGGALLPGLHDHHIHLFALAARASSLWCGPPEVTSESSLNERLRWFASTTGKEGWIRAVGWDDTISGWPDRWTLDAAVSDRPLRLQHRSGAMWVLNSAGLVALGLESGVDAASRGVSGLELDTHGSPTGRLTGLDAVMRDLRRAGGGAGHAGVRHALGDPVSGDEGHGSFPGLRALSKRLATRGVTGVTDATEHNAEGELEAMARAARSGEIVQNIVAMTRDPAVSAPEGIQIGPVKIVLFDPDLPALSDVISRIEAAHDMGRAVAVHAASRMGVVLAVTALGEAGCGRGDRIEHASIVPEAMLEPLSALGVTVVTQPHFIAESGDRYRATVEPRDQPWLYRCRSLVDHGVPLAAGSDAPVGGSDPWAIMAAAVQRQSASGKVMAPRECLTPEQALALFTGQPDLPGGPARRIEPGAPAELCILDRSWSVARTALAQVKVVATVVGGRLVHRVQ